MSCFLSSHKTLFSVALSASLLAGMTSCQDEDFGYGVDEVRASVYARNFENYFGKISPDQTWDLSSYNLNQLGLKGGPTDFLTTGGALTRAFEGNADNVRATLSDWYNVPTATINWLNRNMMERYNHSGSGNAFNLINPYYDDNSGGESRDFLIIPIYQGSSGMTWDLHLVDDQNDYNIWSKSSNIEYLKDYTEWEEFFYNGSETNSVWNADPDKAIPATNIRLKDAFGGKIKSDDGPRYYWTMCFELPRYNANIPNSADGSFTGSFYVFETDSNDKITKKALVTNIGTGGVVSFSQQGRDANGALTSVNGVTFDGIVGKSYTADDGTSIAVEDNFSNLLLETTVRNNCSFDPYDPQRIKIFVKSTRALSDVPWLKDTDYTQLQDFEGTGSDKKSVSFFKGHTINRNHVRTKVMKIDSKKIGREFALYLQTTYSDKNNANYAKEGTRHRSNGNPPMMRALTAFSSDNSPLNQTELEATLADLGLNYTNCEYMVIGCEDANGSASDWDYNDVVFLFVGLPKVPQITRNVVQKRYMIEDLGSTFDFDFNDIVVDVTDEEIYDIANNKWDRKQVVSIAHLCGTIPFEVHIGNEKIGKWMGQNNNNSEWGYDPKTDPAYATKYVRTYTSNFPWDPQTNNIEVLVWPNAKRVEDAADDTGISSIYDSDNNLLDIKDAQRITFPKTGKYPYIIAFDQDINWMKELQSVPRSWFTTEEIKTDYDQNTQHPSKPVEGDLTDAKFASLNLGYLVSESSIANGSKYENGKPVPGKGISTVNIGSIFTEHMYREGVITVTVAMSPDTKVKYNEVEVKGTFYRLESNGTHTALPDAFVDLQDFEPYSYGGVNVIKKSVDLTSNEMMEAAEDGTLRFEIEYSSFSFKDVPAGEPRARVLVKWDPAVPYGILSTDWSVTADDDYGTQLLYKYEKENTDESRNKITVGSGFDDSYTSDQNAYITFVLPKNSSLKGNFYAFDDKGFFYSTYLDLNNDGGGERAYTIKLSEEYKRMLGHAYGNWNGQFRLVVNDATGCSVNPDDANAVKVYVDWDANYLELDNSNDREITLYVGGSNKAIQFKTPSEGTLNASGFDNTLIDVAVDGKKITVTPKAEGTTTITVDQAAWSAGNYNKASNKVNIKVNVKAVSIPEATISLSKDMVYNWTGTDHASLAATLPSGVELQLGERLENTDGFANVFGNGISANTYLNLCDADNMVLEVDNSYAGPVFHYNNGITYNDESAHEIYEWESKGYLTKVAGASTTTWIINIKKIRETEGHFHLNAITTPWKGATKVNSIKIDKYVDPVMEETKQLAANDNNNDWKDITEEQFIGNCSFNGAKNSVGYGCNSNPITADDYVDLSNYRVLKIAVNPDATVGPRLLFNMDEEGKNFVVSMNDNASYIKQDDQYKGICTLYYVNLSAIKRSQGKVRLNVLKKYGWNNDDVFSLFETPKIK